ncbi:hypothetical protein E3U55_06335 [Filobacillus milosensis]|uniref:Uncharacterized protein YyaB-like PH domain-containing protein n=1 Tax=Filobacillus milosensis TaxID=94137 RepID=A0A4Y8IS76_9BACI|nr:PH domain-containing protein [Filobacillus milosensis]TFB22852.1 hypothetical protein E3U55_06335 [Filobacillus milosensis]
MVNYFPSKRDWWLGVIIWGLPIVMIFNALISVDVIGLIISPILSLFLMWIWFKTGYKIDGSTLYVQSGPIKRKIDITKIQSLKKSHTLWASPALSLDRLEILYERDFRYAVISPKHEREFAQALLEVNPNIKLDDKLKGGHS